MTHIESNLYICRATLKRFRRTVAWEYGILTVIWDPAD